MGTTGCTTSVGAASASAAAAASARATAPAGASLPRLDSFKPRGGPPRASRRARWRAVSLILVHLAIVAHVAHWRLAGETLSPLEPSEAMETLELGYVNAGFLVFGALILITLVLGRFFCGWACHVVAYQDLCAWLLKKVGLKPRPVRSRLLLLVPLGAAFYMFAWPTIARWFAGQPAPELEWAVTTSAFWETFPGPWVAALTFLVDGFLIVYWLGGKGFCSYGCPYGAIFGVADRFATGRIKVTDACETCGHCTATCTSNVRVHEEVAKYRMVVDPGCMKCMDCISVCPKEALYFGFAKPAITAPRRRARPSDFTWGEELVMLAVFVAALWTFRGLYDVVPFLLALGLSVLSAIFAITAWRLLRRRDLRFQNRALRTDGRLTRAGRAALWGLTGFAALFLHSAYLRVQLTRAHDVAQSGFAGGLSPTERRARLSAGLKLFEHVDAVGLLPDPIALTSQGRVLRELGRVDLETDPVAGAERAARHLDAAESRLRDSLALRPEQLDASVALADLVQFRGDLDDAEAILADVLARRPHHAPARVRMQMLEQRRAIEGR